jgi:hypothetical protein
MRESGVASRELWTGLGLQTKAAVLVNSNKLHARIANDVRLQGYNHDEVMRAISGCSQIASRGEWPAVRGWRGRDDLHDVRVGLLTPIRCYP